MSYVQLTRALRGTYRADKATAARLHHADQARSRCSDWSGTLNVLWWLWRSMSTRVGWGSCSTSGDKLVSHALSRSLLSLPSSLQGASTLQYYMLRQRVPVHEEWSSVPPQLSNDVSLPATCPLLSYARAMRSLYREKWKLPQDGYFCPAQIILRAEYCDKWPLRARQEVR